MTDFYQLNADRTAAQQWARELLADRDQFVILDTETTGLGPKAEIVEISVTDGRGGLLLDSLVKPIDRIPLDAYRVHKISDDDVAQAPTFDKLIDELLSVISDKRVVVYNASYDSRLVAQSAERRGRRFTRKRGAGAWECAMLQYARFFGDWSDWHGSYKWQSLVNACSQLGAEPPSAPAHRALGDCLRTLQVIEGMAQPSVDELLALVSSDFPVIDRPDHVWRLTQVNSSGGLFLQKVAGPGAGNTAAKAALKNLVRTPAGWQIDAAGVEIFAAEGSR